MAKPKKYEELIRPFVREFGSALADLSPSQIDEISSLIQSGDIAGARQRMSYIAAAGRGAEYVPRGTKRYSPANDAPGGELAVREARPSVEYPVATYSPPSEAARPIPTIRIPPRDTSGDNIRNLLKYGAEAAAIGGGGYLAATYPWGNEGDQADRQPSEEDRQAAVRASLEAQRERHFQEIMAERFRRNPGMATPRE